jgi:hypothetical protein
MEEILKEAIHNVEEDLKNAEGFKKWLYKRHLSLLKKMLQNVKTRTVRIA